MFSGNIIGLSDVVAGMTILSFGSAIPDMITSAIIMKKNSNADMSICGAIASNRFAILIGLGFPWFIKCTLNWITAKSFQMNFVTIQSSALPFSSLILLIAIVFLFYNFYFHSWKLTISFAITCMIIYFSFISIAIVLEIYLN